MNAEAVESFFGWINERHAIYQRRLKGNSAPWTDDPILREYKFTNPFRENDRVTVWMRKNWTTSQTNAAETIFNCCLFRMVGTIEFAEQHGLVFQPRYLKDRILHWVPDKRYLGWDPEYTKRVIESRLEQKLRTFTGAYIITNQGIKAPKSEVVVDYFLKPIWEDRWKLANIFTSNQKGCVGLKNAHAALMKYRGFGGGGFMAYEVVTDLFYTNVLDKSEDRYQWANAGPGAKRGLNRIHDRPLKQSLTDLVCQTEMRELLSSAGFYIGTHINRNDVDMRCIEHSLCEWDKYERVRLKQGRPRSKFRPKSKIMKGAVK